MAVQKCTRRFAVARTISDDELAYKRRGVAECGHAIAAAARPLTAHRQWRIKTATSKLPTSRGDIADMAEPARARPKPTPETQHFWDGTQAGELRLQRCDACANVYFPPRPFCPSCASRKVSVFKASGKGKLYSYVINHRPAAPGFTPPYAIAVVELDEGPRMMSNIIDCPQTPEALELDMKLEVAFEKLDDKITLPLFRPAKG
jgi:uncharacterized OB-fold protein